MGVEVEDDIDFWDFCLLSECDRIDLWKVDNSVRMSIVAQAVGTMLERSCLY